MSYTIQPSWGNEGAAEQFRTLLTGFDGTDLITWTGNLTAGSGNVLGGTLHFRDTIGDGNYYIIDQVSLTSARVQPTPPTGAVTGTIRSRTGGATVQRIHNALAVTGFPANNRIQAVNIGTAGVQRLDKVSLSPLGTNEGVYLISSIIGNNEVQIFGTPLVVAAPAGDTASVYEGRHEILVVDEAAPTMALCIAAATVFQADHGVVADYINEFIHRTGLIPLTVGREFRFRGIMLIRLRSATGSTNVEFFAENELWVNEWSEAFTIHFWGVDGVGPGAHSIRIGDRGADDILSGRDGCFLWGAVPLFASGSADLQTLTLMYASAYIHDTGGFVLPDGSEMATSLLLRAQLLVPKTVGSTATDLKLESINFSGAEGLLPRGDGVTMTNLTQQLSAGGTGAGGNAVIEGLLLGSGTQTPAYQTIFSTLIFLNPRADYDLDRMVSDFLPGFGFAFKRYTYNPRFVSRSAQGTPGNPILGLTVRIFDVNETTQVETEISGSPFTTLATGRLPSPPDLKREDMLGNPTVYTTFNHRLIVTGTGFRAIDQVVTMTSRFDGDVAVDFLATDYDDEMST